jgi:hypothetical protein
MIILSIDNFKKLGKENWNNATVSEAIDLHHIGYDFKWINKDILHKGTEAFFMLIQLIQNKKAMKMRHLKLWKACHY